MTTLQCSAIARTWRRAARLLNLGCGARFHRAWVNIDLQPACAGVRGHDVCQPLPFDAGTFDAVYHSHVLEHLPPDAVLPLLQECRRVLCAGGTLRLVVPDLEQVAGLYLQALASAWAGDAEAARRHRWLVMELIDQAAREQPGGAMLRHLGAGASDFAWQRLGADAAHVRAHLQRAATEPAAGWRKRLRGWLRGSWRERLIRWLLGSEYALLQVGRFRRGGEVHRWMYDRVSLRSLLHGAGFTAFRCVTADESDIPHWDSYHLDLLPDGRPAKPDSLYIEARKP